MEGGRPQRRRRFRPLHIAAAAGALIVALPLLWLVLPSHDVLSPGVTVRPMQSVLPITPKRQQLDPSPAEASINFSYSGTLACDGEDLAGLRNAKLTFIATFPSSPYTDNGLGQPVLTPTSITCTISAPGSLVRMASTQPIKGRDIMRS